MPRGVKKAVDIDAQIQQIEVKIFDLEEQKQKLIQKKKADAAQKLMEFLEQHGMTPEEAMESLTAAVAAATPTSSPETLA